MTYRIEMRPAALRALKKIDKPDQRRIQAAILLLGSDPRPPGAQKLVNRDAWRVRVRDYRIIYQIRDRTLLVVVFRCWGTNP